MTGHLTAVRSSLTRRYCWKTEGRCGYDRSQGRRIPADDTQHFILVPCHEVRAPGTHPLRPEAEGSTCRRTAAQADIGPFINKIGNAIASGIVGATVIISGISQATSAADVTGEGLVILKAAMFILPLVCILAGYVVYRLKYKIDGKMYSQILEDLQARGDIRLE